MSALNLFRKQTVSPKLKAALGYSYSRRDLENIQRLGTVTTIDAGEVFVTEGAVGREVLLILDGTAAVSRAGEQVATVASGDFVGERAVLLSEPRNASLIATSDLNVIVFSDVEFRSLLRTSPDVKAKIGSLVSSRA